MDTIERPPAELGADVVAILRALADPVRLQVAGRVAERPATAGSIAEATGLSRAVVDRAFVHLEAAGAVRRRDDGWALDHAGLAAAARVLAGLAGADSHEAPPLVAPDGRPLSPEESKVIRSFVVDGRLVSIPAHGRKREIVLRWLLEAVFAEDRDYPEAEVNQRLALFHRDVASLRRYMVDSGLVARDHGLYRRRAPAVLTP